MRRQKEKKRNKQQTQNKCWWCVNFCFSFFLYFCFAFRSLSIQNICRISRFARIIRTYLQSCIAHIRIYMHTSYTGIETDTDTGASIRGHSIEKLTTQRRVCNASYRLNSQSVELIRATQCLLVWLFCFGCIASTNANPPV